MPAVRTLTVTDVAAWLLCTVAFAFGVWGLQVGWNHGIMDVHSWRQTHTAISAYEMASRDGPFWTYRTPLFGPPWQWPLELPVYQWTTARASRLLPLDLERAGRLVSVAFYAIAFIPGWVALEVFGVAPRHRPVVLALVWASPLYIFWSRTFMIESTALCFAVSYFALVHLATRPSRHAVSGPLLAAAAAMGALAGTVKVTTFTAFLAAASLLLVWRWHVERWPRQTLAAVMIAGVLLPTAATGAWLGAVDHLKATSPLAAEVDFASEREQRFGTVAERFQPRSWYAVPANAILGGTRHAVIASPMVFGIAFAAAMAWRRRRLAITVCLAVYFIPIAIFMRLFLVHVYYAYENALLLAVITGCGIVSCLEGGRLARYAGIGLLTAALAAMSTNYLAGYYVDQESADLAPSPLATWIRNATSIGDTLLIYGILYTPELAYETQRRAIMDTRNRGVDDPAMRTVLARLAGEGAKIGAVISCGGARPSPVVRANINRLGFPDAPAHTALDCDVYIRR
ncbi:MAG: hypothetical protein JWL71_4366 [Acidobacteria bacterium]|nr:hypothetical protein [Acidobacteriota bacterium]